MQKLEAYPHILKIHKRVDYLKIVFDTGTPEYWALSRKGLKRHKSAVLFPFKKKHFDPYRAPTYRQFEVNELIDPEEFNILKDHFIIKRKDLKKMGWCDLRFKIHDIAAELAEEGYVDIKYTDEILKKDYDDLINEDLGRFQHGLIRFSAFASLPPSGRRLIMHFMPCAAKDKWIFDKIYKTIHRIKRQDITREEIVYRLSKPFHTTRYPAFHRAVFKQWCPINGLDVYDLHPDWGFRALAVWSEGGNYYCDSSDHNLEKMGDFVGGNVSSIKKDYYDLIVLSDVHPVNTEEAHKLIKRYRKMADKVMISIFKDDLKELSSHYKPESILRLHNDIVGTARDDNYLLIIKS